MAVTMITVTGTYLLETGGPASGQVDFVLSAPLQDAAAKRTYAPIVISAPLVGGAFSVALVATNDPSSAPTGLTYLVTPRIVGVTTQIPPYSIVVPYTSTLGTADLSSLAPVANTAVSASYVLLTAVGAPNGVASLDGTGKVPATQLPASGGGAGLPANVLTKTAAYTALVGDFVQCDTNSRSVADGVTTNASTTLTSATAAFTAADVGRGITGTGIPAATTITSVTNATTVVLSAAATVSGTALALTIGGAFTVLLPLNPAVGALVAVKKIDASGNQLTIVAQGGGTTDGDPSTTTVTRNAGGIFEHMGANVWKITASMTSSSSGGAPLIENVNVVAAAGTAQTIPAVTSFTYNRLTLTAATCTLTFPALTAGTSFTAEYIQDATGGRLIAHPTSVKWPGGTAPTLTAAANKTDLITYLCNGTNWLGAVAGLNY